MAKEVPVPMLTEEELIKMHTRINSTAAKEAHAQAQARLADHLETKKVLEQKAASLFSGYVAVSIAAGGAAFAVSSGDKLTWLFWPLVASSGCLWIGALVLALAQRAVPYPSLGWDPQTWIVDGYINGGGNSFAVSMAIRARRTDKFIIDSRKANARKAILIDIGLCSGLASVLIFATIACTQLFVATHPFSHIHQHPVSHSQSGLEELAAEARETVPFLCHLPPFECPPSSRPDSPDDL